MSLDMSFKRNLEQIKDEHKDNSYASQKQKMKELAKEVILASPNLENEILGLLSSGLPADKKIELLEKYKEIAAKKEPSIDDLIARIDAKLDVVNNGKRSR